MRNFPVLAAWCGGFVPQDEGINPAFYTGKRAERLPWMTDFYLHPARVFVRLFGLRFALPRALRPAGAWLDNGIACAAWGRGCLEVAAVAWPGCCCSEVAAVVRLGSAVNWKWQRLCGLGARLLGSSGDVRGRDADVWKQRRCARPGCCCLEAAAACATGALFLASDMRSALSLRRPVYGTTAASTSPMGWRMVSTAPVSRAVSLRLMTAISRPLK